MTGTVNIRGKEYQTVAKRIADFRKVHPDWSVRTEIVAPVPEVLGTSVVVRATITDETGRIIATGLAEERPGSTGINKTSALENAETSAVGRALAFLGLGGDYGIASADEVLQAVQAQGSSDTESAPTTGAATDGIIARIMELVDETAAAQKGKALQALAKTKGAIAWRDLPASELGALALKLDGQDVDTRTAFLNSWAGR